MRLLQEKIGKSALAFLLVFTMCMGLISAATPLRAKATDVPNREYDVTTVANGNFELGRNGYSVKNWSKTAMTNGHTFAEAGATAEAYCKSYSLTTAVDNGNKVAALEKKGAGQVAATSETISVTANTDYSISFDYKILDMNLPEGTTISDFNGVRLYVLEFDAEGNTIAGKGLAATTMYYKDVTYVLDTLRSGMGTFTTSATTDKVVIYLYTGATKANITFTVYFDNVVLKEVSDDYEVLNGTFDYLTHKKDGGRAEANSTRSEMGPAGWGMYDANGNHYKVTTVQDVNKGNVACMTFADNDTTGGNSSWLSPFIPVQGQKDLTVAFDYNLIMDKVAGSTTSVDPSVTIRIFQYNSSKSFKGVDNASGAIKAATTDWTKAVKTVAGTNLDASTAYIRIGFYVGLSDAEAVALEEFKLYLDNVALDVNGQTLGFAKVSTKDKGEVNGSFTSNYAIRKVDAGTAYQNAVQLYVTRPGGGMGGTTFYSEPTAVTPGTEYKTEFDFKVEGVTEKGRNYGADYLLRYRTEDGQYLNSGNPDVIVLNTGNADNTGWKHCTPDTFIVPEGVVAVEVGLLIGVTTMNYNPDLKNTFANIAIAPANDTEFWSEYAERAKDPAVTSSPLYQQSALFVGDMIGSGMSEVAASYSEMRVANVCSDNAVVEEQLITNETCNFDYIVVSVGNSEIQASITPGNITDSNTYMNGVPFDTANFAGLLEQIFAKITEYKNPRHIVYVLPTDVEAYVDVAKAVTEKWGVALAVLSETSDSVKNWNDVIEHAEQAVNYHSYDVPRLLEYMTDVVELVSTCEGSMTNVARLGGVLMKAEGCPTEHAQYTEFAGLVDRIRALIEAYYPMMCGATIAKEDANQLRFIAVSPKQNLSSSIQVKKMGIILTPAVTDAKQMDIETTYTGAEIQYEAILSGAKVDPAVEYAAQAYIVYEEDGVEYTFFSRNDYINQLGEMTTEDGVCEKSVYGIAKCIALKIAPKQGANCAAIGGSSNIALIKSATEETEDVSLQDVFWLVSDNKEFITSWLSKVGGAF